MRHHLGESHEKFLEIREAYEALVDEGKRRKYDEELARHGRELEDNQKTRKRSTRDDGPPSKKWIGPILLWMNSSQGFCLAFLSAKK